jgi:O-antigen biosynthesis protein
MGMGRLRQAVTRRLKDRPPAAFDPRPVPAANAEDTARQLVRAGLVDLEFYRTLSGQDLESESAAARHLLAEGIELGLTCHPLLEPGSLPPRLYSLWMEGQAFRPIMAAKRGNLSHTSPLFDVQTWVDLHPDSVDHPGGPLGHFVATARPDTRMPTGSSFFGSAPTWGEARRQLLAHAADFQRQAALLGGRYCADWDSAKYADWVETWSRAPLPSLEGGPVVSVIIPVKNRPQVIVEAIESVRAQSFESWELLVVDDGSTDETPEVLRAQAARDPRIRVIELGTSQGAGAARNAGIDAARGHYLAFLDSDNTWEPDFLRLCLAFAYGNGHRFVYAVAQVASTGKKRFLAYRGGADALMVQNHIPMIAFVAEASLIRDAGKFDPSLRRWIDFDLLIRMARMAEPEFLPFVGTRYDNIEGTEDRISRVESGNWRYAVFGKNLVDWEAVTRTLAQRTPGRVSVIVETHEDHKHTTNAVTAVLNTTQDHDVEVLVVDNGSPREVTASLTAHFLGTDRVKILRMPRNYHYAAAANAAFAASTGEYVVFIGNETEARAGWLQPLVTRLKDPEVLGAQSLLLTPSDIVDSAGWLFLTTNGIATPYLEGHPLEDALRDGGRGVHGLSRDGLAMTAEDFSALRGFDSLFVDDMEDVDLCLRAAELRDGRFEVVLDSRVTHLRERQVERSDAWDSGRLFLDRWRRRLPPPSPDRYSALGLSVTHVASGPGPAPVPRPLLLRAARPGSEGETTGVPQLRWSVNIGSPGGWRGDLWGDTYFGYGLAEGLRALGQEVVVLRRGADDHPMSYLADVALTIRGLKRVHPRPGLLNVLWVISHPDLVKPEEVRDFDLVFAASESWAAAMSARAGLPVHVLHQATNSELFHPGGATDEGEEVLFVGNGRRDIARKIVEDALSAGVALGVYGVQWEEHLPAGVLLGESIDNRELGRRYSGAGIVLNDHWDDMARHGFLNNRLFDAVASGARVVSDHVEGAEELFKGAVKTYRTVDELAWLCSDEGRASFPAVEERRHIADLVRSEHNFHKRAEQLLAAALEARQETTAHRSVVRSQDSLD